MSDTPSLDPARARLRALYSGEVFAQAAGSWSKLLSEHFTKLDSRAEPVLNWMEPEQNTAAAAAFLDAPKSETVVVDEWLPTFSKLLQAILDRGQNLHHPRYLGHQVPASIPIAALFDAIGSATNQVMAIYEMGPWATAVERAMIARLGAEIGYRAGSFSGAITSGGSLANLTALLTARNVVINDVWSRGLRDSRGLAMIVQADAHYCITRAAGILGLGTEQIVRIPVDQQRRMRIDQLQAEVQRLKAQGRTIIAVAAGACATPIGAFDPLNAIADICEQEGIWFHVDAAHGGAAVMSPRYRHLVDGIQRADSVVWDAHKMLFMPALCAFVFYKDRSHRFAAFQQDAPYLFDPSNPGIAEYDSGTQTLECTKRAAAYGLWGIWSLFGRQLFTDLVDVSFELAQSMYRMLRDASDFQPLHVPECNIQAFRYLPESIRDWPLERIGDFQLQLRRQLITSGKAYIVPMKFDGVGALRATLINPCTTDDDIRTVLHEIRRCGAQLVETSK